MRRGAYDYMNKPFESIGQAWVAVERALEPYRKRMPVRVLEQLRQESVMRRLLEAHGLPRLSLFHLESGGRAAE